jgi:hypothetical protein
MIIFIVFILVIFVVACWAIIAAGSNADRHMAEMMEEMDEQKG